jgi:hypothetical protein
MRLVSVCLLILAIACGAFAYWGIFTPSGARAFDEMDGMIPFFVGLASGPLILAAAICWWLARRARIVDERADSLRR